MHQGTVTKNEFSSKELQVKAIDNKSGDIKFQVSTPCPSTIRKDLNGAMNISEPKIENGWCNYDAHFTDKNVNTEDHKIEDKVRLTPIFDENQ